MNIFTKKKKKMKPISKENILSGHREKTTDDHCKISYHIA